jgi:DNA polymerase-3 subunit alpha (Gram-positive type)
MLKSFQFLGDQVAQQLVVTNPNALADRIDEISPVKDKLYTPKMPGAEDDIKNMTYTLAHKLYGVI